MTSEEIDQLEPGSAMDDLIVQHVYGKNPLEARYGVDPSQPDRPQWHWGYPVGHDFAARFSTDLNAAWDLMAHVMNSIPDTAQFSLFCIQPGSGDAAGWECSLGEFWDDTDRPIGSGDTAPEAMCKAALKRSLPLPSPPQPTERA